MNKRPFEEMDDPPLEEVASGSERYTEDQKVAIIQACLKHSKKLFEKFNRTLDRHTQQDAWTEVLNELADGGIFVSDTHYLRKRVTNWIQRATDQSDKAKKTGVGKQKPLSNFMELCLSFVKEAKGNAAVDYITSVPEPQGTDSSLSVDPVTIDKLAVNRSKIPGPYKMTKKTERANEHAQISSWKQDFLSHIKETDEFRTSAELKIFELKEYNLVLRNMQLEQALGLNHKAIEDLRSTVNPSLNRYPRHTTEYL